MILFEHILKKMILFEQIYFVKSPFLSGHIGDLQVEEIFRPFDICFPPEPIKA